MAQICTDGFYWTKRTLMTLMVMIELIFWWLTDGKDLHKRLLLAKRNADDADGYN
jgi:hypothetical protein